MPSERANSGRELIVMQKAPRRVCNNIKKDGFAVLFRTKPNTQMN